MLDKLKISRRFALRGVLGGISVAMWLPVLDAMCNSNGTASTAPSVSAPVGASSVAAPVTWRPADKTAEFLSAFRPQE